MRLLSWLALIFSLLFASSLSAQPRDLARRDLPAPPRTVEDVLAVLDQYKPDPAAVERLRATARSTPPVTNNRQEIAVFYHRRARAHSELGDLTKTTEDLKQALKFVFEGAPNSENEGIGDHGYILQGLAEAEMSGGNLLKAVEWHEQTIKLLGKVRGRSLYALAALARIYTSLGDISLAQKSLQDIEFVFGQLRNFRDYYIFEHTWKYPIEVSHGYFLSTQGNFSEGERRYRRALEEVDLEYQGSASARRINNLAVPQSLVLAKFAATELQLASNLRSQGRLSEAEYYARSGLLKLLQAFGRYSPRTAAGITELSATIFESGRFADSAALAQAAIESYEKAGATPESLGLARARAELGAALVAQERYSEAIPVFETRDRALASSPEQYARIGGQNADWGVALIKTGQHQRALAILEKIYRQRRERGIEDTEFFTAQSKGFYAMALANAGEHERALAEFKVAVPVLLEQARTSASSEQSGIARHQRLSWIIEAYIRLLVDLRDSPLLRAANVDAIAETFRVADAARGSSVQRALAASAARATPDDPALAELARREQDTQQRMGALGDLLNRLLAAPPAQQLPKVIGEMRRDVESLRAQHAQLKRELDKRFPEYAGLIDPRPVTLAQAQSALKTGEALVSIYVGADQTYVWALPYSGPPAFTAVPLKDAELSAKISQLRNALDISDPSLAAFPKFDLTLSHSLYEQLLKPVEAGWRAATSLLVVPHKALGQIPFSLLVTEKPLPAATTGLQFEEYRTAPWLLRRMAVTQLPSTSTLVALRNVPQARGTRREFIGFGDPLFNLAMAQQSEQTDNSPALRGRFVRRNLTIDRVATMSIAGTTQTARSAPTPVPVVAAVSNSSGLAQLARLPDTAHEVRDIARVLGADTGSDIFLGRAASEKNVKSGQLANRRVIVFATHGLVPGDLNGLIQPALALSAPDVTGNADEDGLLTLDEILSLKLNADWVVLSACNTASGDGIGGEAVSGLGRAFFYAGARSLLVSNWPVETVSASLLTTQLFERQAADATLSRAEALRRTMLDLLDRGIASDPVNKLPAYAYAHPMFWAPFSLVGDGGK